MKKYHFALSYIERILSHNVIEATMLDLIVDKVIDFWEKSSKESTIDSMPLEVLLHCTYQPNLSKESFLKILNTEPKMICVRVLTNPYSNPKLKKYVYYYEHSI